jgi:hypothetical protein
MGPWLIQFRLAPQWPVQGQAKVSQNHTDLAIDATRVCQWERVALASMGSSERKSIPDPVTNRLFALSGNQCAFPGCMNEVTDQEPGEQPVTLAQRAHIVGVGRQGPRSRAVRLADDIDAVENLVLLCGEHHRIVDAYPRIYSVEVLAKYKADHETRMAPKNLRSAPPMLEVDTVDLSILPISGLPGSMWRAASPLRTGEEVAAQLPRPRGDQVLPFVLLNGEVWAFENLANRRGPFKRAVDPGTAEQSDAAALLKSEDRFIYIRLLNGALRDALLRRGVRLDRSRNRFYFLPDHETVTRRVQARTKTGRMQSAKKVVRQQGAGSDHPRDIWWHLAAQLRFEEFAPGCWGLTIRPEFQLTKDGRVPLEPWRVGRKVTSRKSRIYNEGYFDAVHFFRYFLLDGKPRLTLRAGQQAITVDGDFPGVRTKWPHIADKRFDPISMLDSGNEDDVLDALAGTWEFDDDEWDWGAEHSEDDQ